MTIEAWNSQMLGRAIDKGLVEKTSGTQQNPGGAERTCVRVHWDLWDKYFSMIVAIARELNSVTENMNERQCQDVADVREKLWQRLDEKFEAVPETCDGTTHPRELFQSQKDHVANWILDMTQRVVPRAGYFQFEATGVTEVNRHMVSILQTLEELRITVACCQGDVCLEGGTDLEVYGAEVMDWMAPGGSALAKLRGLRLDYVTAFDEDYVTAFAANLIDVDLMKPEDADHKKEKEKETSSIQMKPPKEWKIFPMMTAIFAGLQNTLRKKAAEELVDEIRHLLHGELKITVPDLVGLEWKLQMMSPFNEEWTKLNDRVQEFRQQMLQLEGCWTISYRVSMNPHTWFPGAWKRARRDEDMPEAAMKKVFFKAQSIIILLYYCIIPLSSI
jgi:hypothetical protein